jgi:hypothetical protein
MPGLQNADLTLAITWRNAFQLRIMPFFRTERKSGRHVRTNLSTFLAVQFAGALTPLLHLKLVKTGRRDLQTRRGWMMPLFRKKRKSGRHVRTNAN